MQCLYESFEEEAGYVQFATAITSNDIDEIQKFLDASVDGRYSLFTFWCKFVILVPLATTGWQWPLVLTPKSR